MAGEAANNQAFWLCLPDNHVRLQADERNVIQQIEELINIMRRIRNGEAGIADLLEEYERRKRQLTEDPDQLGGIVDTYLHAEHNPRRSALKLMDASNNTIHIF